MSKSSNQVSEIDRLIELASDDRPPGPIVADHPVNATRALSLEDQKDPSPSMWRVLLQLRVLLPYLAKVLPLVERGLLGTNITGHAASVDTSHFDRGIAATQAAQRDMSTALVSQSADIKLLHEQLASLGTSLERQSTRQEEFAAAITSLTQVVKTGAWVIVVLLLVLIGLVGFALLNHFRG
jgi:hypothetical protein